MNRNLALPALALLAACTTTGASQPALTGSTWRFVAIDGAAPVADETSLSFERNRINVNAGCNNLGGDLAIKGNKLAIGAVFSTMMYCGGRMDQERAVNALLAAGPEWRIEGGRLMLRGGGHSAELVAAN